MVDAIQRVLLGESLSASWLEPAVRSAIVYLVLLAIFRVASKRELAQATLFDFLTILLIANVVQNAMIGNNDSLAGGIAGALTLCLLSHLFSRITSRSPRARRVLEGEPVLLIKEGTIQHDMMHRQAVSMNDLLSAVRKHGYARLADVSYAILELDGSISVIRADEKERPHDCLPKAVVGSESAEV